MTMKEFAQNHKNIMRTGIEALLLQYGKRIIDLEKLVENLINAK